jgi:hypothetical protein
MLEMTTCWFMGFFTSRQQRTARRDKPGAAIQYLAVGKVGGLLCYGGHIIRITARILFIEVSLLFTGIGARCYRSLGGIGFIFCSGIIALSFPLTSA